MNQSHNRKARQKTIRARGMGANVIVTEIDAIGLALLGRRSCIHERPELLRAYCRIMFPILVAVRRRTRAFTQLTSVPPFLLTQLT
jgi:hypothetical protein